MSCKLSSLFSGSNRYRPTVRIGNWFEENCLEEDKIRLFKQARDRGELLVEKARSLFDNFHKEIALEAPKEHIRFGAVVQLMPCYMSIANRNTDDMNPALSVIINERVVRHSQDINEECELTVAPSVRPCVRNSFRIISGDDNDRTNELLKYGQHFRLQCVEPVSDPILLFSAPKKCNLTMPFNTTFDSHKFGEINLPLGVVRSSNCGPGRTVPSAYTNWFCVHIDPHKRFESVGSELPSNSPLVITHAATNKNLAAENVIIQTLFGPEFLVSVQNYRNIYKREIWKNVWMISNGHQNAGGLKRAKAKAAARAAEEAERTKLEDHKETVHKGSSKFVTCDATQVKITDDSAEVYEREKEEQEAREIQNLKDIRDAHLREELEFMQRDEQAQTARQQQQEPTNDLSKTKPKISNDLTNANIQLMPPLMCPRQCR